MLTLVLFSLVLSLISQEIKVEEIMGVSFCTVCDKREAHMSCMEEMGRIL